MNPHILIIFLVFTLVANKSVECKIVNRSDSYENVSVNYWLPEITIPKGWIHSGKESAYSSTYSLIRTPDEFVTMRAVAKARSDTPGLYTLKMYVDNYISRLVQSDLGFEAKEEDAIRTSNGSLIRLIYLMSRKTNNFVLDAFAEEGGYYVNFSIESSDELKIEKYKNDFIGAVASYSPPLPTGEELAKEVAAENFIRTLPLSSDVLKIIERINAGELTGLQKVRPDLFAKHYRLDVYKNIIRRGLVKYFSSSEIDEIARLSKDPKPMNDKLAAKYIIYSDGISEELQSEIIRTYKIVQEIQNFESR